MIPLIYVAGRYRAPTREAIAQNIDAARQVGVAAALLGWYPVIPHANTAHMELNTPHGDDFWLDGALELMTRCDAVVLVPGWESSEGTKGEIAKARALGLPVYETLDWLQPATYFEPFISSNSPKYKAELYDEVWKAARDRGFGNVVGALAALDTLKAELAAMREDRDSHQRCAIRAMTELAAMREQKPVALTDLERNAVAGLIELASSAFHLADDGEDDGGEAIKVPRDDMAELERCLDALDELPDDQPGYTLGPSGRAEWALRRLFDGVTIMGQENAAPVSAPSQVAAEVVQASEFRRENRYIVIKRNDLKNVPVNYRAALVEPMLRLLSHLPRREYLVVESDWPEYQATWEAIERRVLATCQDGATAKAGE